MSSDPWNEAISAAGSPYAAPRPARTGSAATASRPAVRATALSDPARKSRVAVRRRGQHCGRERRDRSRQPEPEESDPRQNVGEVGRVLVDPEQKQGAGRRESRAHRHGQPGPDARGQLAGPGRQRQHEHGDRQQRGAREHWSETGGGLEHQHEQEEDRTERGVDKERHHVGRSEKRGGEDAQRQHRVCGPLLGPHEGDARRDTDERGAPGRGRGRAPLTPGDERKGDPAEEEYAEGGPPPVRPRLGLRVPTLGHVAHRHQDHHDRDG